MRDKDLFQIALGLTDPWLVKNCIFDPEKKQLDIWIDFSRGGEFPCPECGHLGCKAYDTEDITWRHMNFFEHKTYLNARTPRIDCPKCGIKVVDVPWARKGSRFTILFEAIIMSMAKEMPVNAVARQVGEHDTRIWRVLQHYVEQAREQQDYSGVTKIGIDETSSKKGHKYISIFVDMEERKVLFATKGKGAETVNNFRQDLETHGGGADHIKEVCCDMSPAFISGIEDNFEDADITFDKFHVIKIINDAVDKVRRQERLERFELKYTRYLWLKNPKNLTEGQIQLISNLVPKKLNLKTARAYHMKLSFQDVFQQPQDMAEAFLKKWYFWATHSRLQPMIEAARTVKRHWDGILRWFISRITNGILEGINSLIQAAKAKARGYRSTRNFITMVYLVAGKLEFGLPT